MTARAVKVSDLTWFPWGEPGAHGENVRNSVFHVTKSDFTVMKIKSSFIINNLRQ
jgi:hypothetical protein